MEKEKRNSFNHALYFINQYRHRYGFTKFVRALIHYSYRFLKKSSLKNNIISVNGYKLKLIPNDLGISSELSVFKMHEPITTYQISKNLKKGMTCLDIGANLGYFALLEAKVVGKEGKVIAIEPSPLNFEHLKENFSLQNLSKYEVYNFAGGNKNGSIRFFQNDRSNGSQTLSEGQDPPPNKTGRVITVPVKKIDDFLTELNPDTIDFIRMDVEGYEFEIFQGMQNTLEKFSPFIQIEVHKGRMGIEKTKNFLLMLKNNNYEIDSFHPRDLDVPIIGTKNDIKYMKMEKLIEMIENELIPNFFNVTLKHQSRNKES